MIFEEKLAQFGFDMKEYLRRFDDTPQLYQECLTLYTSSRNIDRLCEHYSNGEWEEAQKTAHTLKGSSANLALTKLWDLYSRIVEILKSGDPGTAAPLVQEAAELESQLREAVQGMKKIRRSKNGYTNF